MCVLFLVFTLVNIVIPGKISPMNIDSPKKFPYGKNQNTYYLCQLQKHSKIYYCT